MQPKIATEFKQAVLRGDFETALALLPDLGPSPANLQRAKVLLLSQKYTECIHRGDRTSALHCLRHELQPLQTEIDSMPGSLPGALPSLAAMLLSHTPLALDHHDETTSRESLLGELHTLLPPSILIPETRLEELVEQALIAQLDRCPYHNSRALHLSLFTDYIAGPEQLPTMTSQVLDVHTDEVWALQFSGDGRWLATASKDGSALLWSVDEGSNSNGDEGGGVQLVCKLIQGARTVNIVAFSPDGKHVLIGAGDGRLRVYKIPSGEQCVDIQVGNLQEGISAAVWLPDSRRVIVAAGSREVQIIDLMQGGTICDRISLPQHTYDLALSRDGGTCIIVGQDRRLRFLRLMDRREVLTGPEPAAVTCLSVSADGRFIAANLANGIIHLWPLGDLRYSRDHPDEDNNGDALMVDAVDAIVHHHLRGRSDPLDAVPNTPLQEYRAGGNSSNNPGRFVIRSTFGGAGCAFVASGSENAMVHIWHRESGELLASLHGHTSTVNAVAWNPRNSYMMASASDDTTVRIWRASVAE